MCAKCRKIDFHDAFFEKRTQPVDLDALCLDNAFCNIAHILNTYQECRCCSLILSGIRRFYPDLLAERNVIVSWHREGMQAKVEAQNGEVEYRSVVHISLLKNSSISSVNLAINLLSPQMEGVESNALRARHVSQHQVEPALITNWISTCIHRHEDCHKFWQGTATTVDRLHLRVIDVQDRCIVDAPKDCEYVALSYVWGDPSKMLQTLKSNLATFSLPQGLDKGLITLPATISDAMELVRAIGQRYLWVDALCIIQDDKDDQLHQISNMNLVYGLARFTIVAANGEGAEAGLVGVKAGSRNIVQDIEEVKSNLHLVVSLGGFGPLQRAQSKWNTRAWTFQEALLSPRMVIFSGGEMTWECREAVWTEDLLVSPGTIGSFTAPHFSNSMAPLLPGRSRADPWVRVSPFTAMSLDNLTMYENAVREYTTRQMTELSDMLNAFAGLAKTFETALATGFVQGLPRNRLDTALLWTPEQALQRRSGFASWSWAGWIGKSRYISMNPSTIKPMVHYCVSETEARGNHTFTRLSQKWEEENYEPSLRPWRVVKPTSLTMLPIPQPGSLPSSYSRLCFYALATSSKHFPLKNMELPPPHFLWPLSDHAGHDVGRMGLDGGTHDPATASLIVLSECSEPVQQEGLGRDLPTAIMPSAQRGEGDEGELPLFNVMLVVWAGGVAERVGLGWIKKVDFWKTKPEWTWVVLR
jgi:hypothetical protein